MQKQAELNQAAELSQSDSSNLLAPGDPIIWYEQRRWGGKQANYAEFICLRGKASARIKMGDTEKTVRLDSIVKRTLPQSEVTFKNLGICKCGKDATTLLQKGIAPGKWSKEVPVCNECLHKLTKTAQTLPIGRYEDRIEELKEKIMELERENKILWDKLDTTQKRAVEKELELAQ